MQKEERNLFKAFILLTDLRNKIKSLNNLFVRMYVKQIYLAIIIFYYFIFECVKRLMYNLVKNALKNELLVLNLVYKKKCGNFDFMNNVFERSF
jgi:hypothetical protein